MGQLTPMMKQYMDIKEQYKDTILFYRLGDFYEMFFDDALEASRVLEIALTGRDCGLEERAPMCGVPYHAANNYIIKLIEKGYKVAICEQVEDASAAKGIVKREVVKVITPGTIVDSNFLEDNRNNYLMQLYIEEQGIGLAVCDISTGFFAATDIDNIDTAILLDEISKYSPREIIIYTKDTEIKSHFLRVISERFDAFITERQASIEANNIIAMLHNQFGEAGIDLSFQNQLLNKYTASALLLNYLMETQKQSLAHINKLELYSIKQYMKLDINTRRSLELTETLREKQKSGSLFGILDYTSTAMGSRMLRRWIEEPLIDINSIVNRQQAIGMLYKDTLSLEQLIKLLKEIYDIERLMARISLATANARDIVALKNSIKVLPEIKQVLSNFEVSSLKSLSSTLDCLEDMFILIDNSIIDNPPFSIKEGNIIKEGYNCDIDRLKSIKQNGKEWIAKLESSEKEKTAIKSLKVGYNKIFGYYIEVTKSNLENVPDYFIRKQTLANCERYITPELKEMESEIIGADDKLVQLEYMLFCEIREQIKLNIKRIQKVAFNIAFVDCICSLAKVAMLNNYSKPEITLNNTIDIKDGRHPVVEKKLKDYLFVPNDTYLDNSHNRMSIITGPNMAGKSTYMRQVALLVLMAQIGSFIPCSSATIGIVDKIFTRVGASDDLAQGQSTFMVEMNELSYILSNATEKSLVILDEIGRGTSTYDGLSIAWAVIEYITDPEKIGCKCLFATHYHELTDLEDKIQGIKNYSVSVKERGEDIIFLRKIIQGGADKSYGIHVAKLAGLPEIILLRSKEILNNLEMKKPDKGYKPASQKNNNGIGQINLFNSEHQKFIEKISSMDINTITPIESINILYKIINEAKKL